MDCSVAFRFCHGERGGSVVKGRKNHQFRMTFFHPFNSVDASKAVHPHRQVFRVIFNDTQRKYHRSVVVDCLTDLIGEHIEVLHRFFPYFMSKNFYYTKKQPVTQRTYCQGGRPEGVCLTSSSGMEVISPSRNSSSRRESSR